MDMCDLASSTTLSEPFLTKYSNNTSALKKKEEGEYCSLCFLEKSGLLYKSVSNI